MQINRRKFQNLVKTGATLALVTTIAFVGYKSAKANNQPKYMDENQTLTSVSIKLEPEARKNVDDRIEEVVSNVYNEDLDQYYGNQNNYEKAIFENNGLQNGAKLIEGNELSIPVIIEKDNALYQEILDLEVQINEIKNSNFFVPYVVKYGDSLSKLAYSAAIDDNEAIEYIQKIRQRNNMGYNDTIIQDGDTIYIVNPELKTLKIKKSSLETELLIQLSKNKSK